MISLRYRNTVYQYIGGVRYCTVPKYYILPPHSTTVQYFGIFYCTLYHNTNKCTTITIVRMAINNDPESYPPTVKYFI